METSLVHTCPNASKIDRFNETVLKRWKDRIYSAIDVVNLGHILVDPKPMSDFEHFSKWENRKKSKEIAVVFSSEVSMVTNIKDWIVDSRATRHIHGYRRTFTSYTMVKEGEV